MTKWSLWYHFIVFYFRTFNNMEINYNIHDKELLAMYEVFRK